MSNPPPFAGDVKAWAEQLTDYLSRSATLQQVDTSTAPATLDGVLVLDPNVPGVYVSWSNAWVQVVGL